MKRGHTYRERAQPESGEYRLTATVTEKKQDVQKT